MWDRYFLASRMTTGTVWIAREGKPSVQKPIKLKRRLSGKIINLWPMRREKLYRFSMNLNNTNDWGSTFLDYLGKFRTGRVLPELEEGRKIHTSNFRRKSSTLANKILCWKIEILSLRMKTKTWESKLSIWKLWSSHPDCKIQSKCTFQTMFWPIIMRHQDRHQLSPCQHLKMRTRWCLRSSISWGRILKLQGWGGLHSSFSQ